MFQQSQMQIKPKCTTISLTHLFNISQVSLVFKLSLLSTWGAIITQRAGKEYQILIISTSLTLHKFDLACKLERERKITKGIKIQRYKKNKRQGGKKAVEHHTQNNSFKQKRETCGRKKWS